MIQVKYKKHNSTGSFALDVNGLTLSKNELENLNKLFEPKVVPRFMVKMEGIPSYLIKETDFPSFDIDCAGKKNFKPLNMVLYDPIYPSGTTAVMEKIEAGTRWDFSLIYLGPVGDIVQRWEVKNPELVSVDFSSARWGGEGTAEIILRFHIKEAEIVKARGLVSPGVFN